ncbi:MAG TPA: hypothetical protein PK325_07825 [Cyclobacteriaceae bacterium]|jgi:hypothetical protein|nr:hypothetical protein [Cyclobacteriaceae bacterium]HMV10568.1 hypothetical protein [Cyclobacteriaceae bacterium]HMV88540.1 hypothetical protein [Cyclobacteriaceae bacterium]HMW99420.1 hypothetical protein [Cyclobacteriaceae bacterium]HMX48791.1 hypothetical protein [Cyclobacteriaceae bacterium]
MKSRTEERYEPAKIEKLIQYLWFYSEKGQPVDYEILIDNFKAVRRTNDPENFLVFKNFIAEDTRVMQVLLFSGSSNNNEKRIFYFGEPPSKNGDKISDRSMKTSNLRLNVDQRLISLQEENVVLKKQISELEKKNDVLEQRQLWFNTLLNDVSKRIVEKILLIKT